MVVLQPSIRKVASVLYATLDTPLSLGVYLRLKYKEWDQLATMAVDPRNYLDVPSGIERYRRDAQAADFLRKLESLPTTIDKKKAAEETFLVCEKQCFDTNYQLEMMRLLAPGALPVVDAYRSILGRARKIIRRILGPVPDSISGSFGPGTAFEMKGQVTTTLADKMWITPHVTRPAELIFRHTYEPTHWARARTGQGLPFLAYTRGNRFTTVPKDGKTHRGICVEPLGNLYAQLGVGSFLKRRLANVGIYVQRRKHEGGDPLAALTTRHPPLGQEVHQRLARDASVNGHLATIDLSNASDTVALELVRELLPSDWFHLLFALRAPMTLFRKKWVHLSKFSSMGNGFTFELETLIFVGLIAGVTGLAPGRDFWVYGDDIVVPTSSAHEVVACLKMSGFTPNPKKTFLSGSFKESCGGDFFAGIDVRPFFLKKDPDNPLDWIVVHNALKRRTVSFPGASAMLRRITDNIPSTQRLSGPSWLGDTCLHRSGWRCHWEHGIRYCKTLASTQRPVDLDRWGSEFVITLALLGVKSDGLVPRDWPGRRVKTVLQSVS